MIRRIIFSFLLVCVNIFVWGQLDAEFSSNLTSGCSPLVVVFSDQTTGGAPTNWDWSFGNGNSSVGSDPSVNQNPSAIYNTPGTYTVTLTVSDGVGSDTETKTAYITVFEDPVADFIASSVLGCAPFEVDFTDLSTSNTGTINQWFWDFGDGNISNQKNPTNIFMTAAMRTVSLVVTDDNGCNNTLQIPNMIEIVDPPTAAFSGTPLLACAPPLNVSFTDASTSTSALTYIWDFGDGNSSNSSNPNNNYTSVGTYDVSLKVTDNLGCEDSLTKLDYVGVQEMTAGFGYISSGCAPATISFTDSSGPSPTSWQWDFGSAGTSSVQNPNGIIFATPGVYQVRLIAANAAGCSDTIIEIINIDSAPVAAFTADVTASCSIPLTVNFTDNSVNANSWFWNFGDGNTSNLQNPTHTYTGAGNFNVSLTVFSSGNCSDAEIKTSYIEIILPQASFAPDTTQGCIPLLVSFTDQSTSNEPIVSWEWDFGDGNTSSSQNPSNTYSTADTFPVSLIITNDEGCTDTLLIDPAVIAGTKPIADFSANPTSICADSVVYFTDLSVDANQWYWDFGDGTTNNGNINNGWVANLSHIYTDTGYFDVMMIAQYNGCPDTMIKDSFIRVNPPIAIFMSQQTCADPSQVNFINVSKGGNKYIWDFGDGDSSLLKNPSHQYTSTGQFLVSLNVQDTISGCEYTSFQYVDITALGVDFVADTLSGCITLPVNFTSNASDAQSWQWDFGDGQTSVMENPSISYTMPGTYTVTLVVTDINACKDTMIKSAYISANGPIVGFLGSPTTGCAPLITQFTDTTISNGTPASWFWSFGTGDSAFTQNPVYQFPNLQGTYSVSLRVIDSAGCESSLTQTNYISQVKPTASFISINTSICPGDNSVFINASSGVGLSYDWDFGDGASSTSTNPTHNYASNGLYTVTLIVEDNNGCKDTLERTDYIEVGASYIGFGADTLGANCAPLLVSFIDSSASSVVSWFWDFGDNTSSVLQNPAHLYTSAGEFDITLIIQDNKGCWDTLVKPAFIDIDGPSGTFTLAPDSGCAPMTVTFIATAINTVNYTWDFGDGSLGTGDSATHTYDAGTYYPILVLDDGLGCNIGIDPPDSILVNLMPYTLTPDTIICPGDIIQLSASGASIYSWNPDPTLSSLNISNPIASPTQSTLYVVSLEDTVGCLATDTIVVTIDTVIASVANNPSTCPGDSVQLQGLGGLYYSWSPSSFLSNDSIADPYASPLQTTSYSLIVSDDYCSDSVIVSVVVHAPPVVDAGFDTSVCFGSSVQAQATGANQYQWSPTVGLSNSDSSVTNIIGDSAQYYMVIGTDTNGCSSSDSLFINVYALPQISAGPDTAICIGESVNLTAAGGDLYLWSPMEGLSDSSGSNIIATPDSSIIYYVTITDQNNCSDTAMVDISIRPLPEAMLGPDQEVLLGMTITLDAVQDMTYYSWDPPQYLSDPHLGTVSCTPLDDITYTLTIIDQYGCQNTEEITITVYNEAKLAIPKAFTPNGDGRNDIIYYYAKGMAKTNLKVFNRWGQMVFESDDASYGWDGTYNGVDLEMDTYTYLLVGETLIGEVFKQKGNLSLIR